MERSDKSCAIQYGVLFRFVFPPAGWSRHWRARSLLSDEGTTTDNRAEYSARMGVNYFCVVSVWHVCTGPRATAVHWRFCCAVMGRPFRRGTLAQFPTITEVGGAG